MAGINQGRPETAVGEPIHFGDIDGFEIEQHPISDRLIIRDTANGKEAYVRAERGGEIGGDGVLIKALKEGKPMNDKGRTYDTIQEAERQASSWVFVPPGTYNESVEINTEGLTLQGCGYNTHITNGFTDGVKIRAKNVVISNLSVSSTSTETIRDAFRPLDNSDGFLIQNCSVRTADRSGIYTNTGGKIINCIFESSNTDSLTIQNNAKINFIGNIVQSSSGRGINVTTAKLNDSIISNNIIKNTSNDGMDYSGDNGLIIGNRVINSDGYGINVDLSNNIVANNRISDSTDSDINDSGTNTLFDGNLTGASN